MSGNPSLDEIGRLFRGQSARAVATLARAFNDFDRAEDAVQEAYATALQRWPSDGIPRNPSAWIISTARNRAIDQVRREKTHAVKHEILARLEAAAPAAPANIQEHVMDDRLEMLFAACHPALTTETRIALTLRFAAGLTVEEIAAALLVSQATVAQRLVRAKRKIREARIPFALPNASALPGRLDDVLCVVYLIFNEGYSSSTHASLIRAELCNEALRLIELLEQLLPAEPEIAGLHALVLFHDARRETRLDTNGDPILLEDQDRSQWDARKIVRGLSLLEDAGRHHRPGPYQWQAAIAAEHARAPVWESTNWFRIRAFYEALYALDPSPVVALNRTVAIAYTDGNEAALRALDQVASNGELDTYAPLYGARAELLRRLHRPNEAAADFRVAIALTQSASERRFLEKRITRTLDENRISDP